ncbi:hypothetical protein D1823_20085 (plasmid) [Ruegeria sp. AD91A]|uniref:hypothetical protein n=1 Tax=Ruegeria sp. AD91A TaxID=2293862 RepID=UPI000E4A10BA|nr:hypothetical protein [Ruegeria sp. AD91A]AXT29003.1 hypothetical protein D1823_20085 [Ruegeria sp. AD91A]
MDLQELDDQLLQAHADSDLPALIRLYHEAASQAEQRRDHDAACFYLTHAFVFALEYGSPEADELNRKLYERGRAHRLAF